MSLFMTDAFTRLRTSGLISLCLINGPAVGGGSELITVCDYRYTIISHCLEAYVLSYCFIVNSYFSLSSNCINSMIDD